MIIGILGGGVVGRATARTWLEHCQEVRVYDSVKERRTHELSDLKRCDLVFICVPESELDKCLTEWHGTPVNMVLRSTVPIGTTRKIRDRHDIQGIVHSPEFLTERCAMTDAQMPAQLIVGVPDWNQMDPDQCGPILCGMYRNRFPGVPINLMLSDESELVKLIVNAFAATKVSFFNEMRALSDAVGCDWQRVIEAVLGDGRIGYSWTKVPGPDGKRGFGGKCLPKDLNTLLECFGKFDSLVTDVVIGRACPLLSVVKYRNKHVDRKEQA